MKKTHILLLTRQYQEALDTIMQRVAVNHFSLAVKNTVESNVQLCINKFRQFEFLLFGSNSAKYTLTQYSWGSPITKPTLDRKRDERGFQTDSSDAIAAMKQQVYDWIFTETFIEDASDQEPSIITKTETMVLYLGQIRTYMNNIDTAIVQNTPSDNS